MADENIVKLIPKSYLVAIRNSIGANTWRNFYALDHGVERDVLSDGDLSCAYFVSSIATMFGLAKATHATIDSTVKDLQDNEWVELKVPKPGAVLVWEPQDFGEQGSFTHIGFYMGEEKAISTSLTSHTPREHDWLFRDTPPSGKTERKMEKILWHERLKG